MPVNATRMVRRMRGGAQAHLLACDDGCYYVTKFQENPQHRRILVNEWCGAVLLRHLQLSAPEVRVVAVSDEFLRGESDVGIHLGSRRQEIHPGWHFGSRFPGNPLQEAVYDYLPDSLLPSVANLNHFLGSLVFDRWTSNSDSRQAIFFRRRLREWLDAPDAAPQQKGFIAQMVDHGYLFDGPHWEFSDSPLQGLYFRPLVYEKVRSLDDFQPWLDRVRHCPESLCDEISKQVPPAWVEGDEAEFVRLLERLMARRKRVEGLLELTVGARRQTFPAWR